MAPNMGNKAEPMKSYAMITPGSRSRGMGRSVFSERDQCICQRPRSRILCCVCGYVGWGRVKHTCPVHPKTIFLIDFSQCPQCRAYAMHMEEF